MTHIHFAVDFSTYSFVLLFHSNMSSLHAPSTPGQGPDAQAEVSPFDPGFEFDAQNVTERGAQIAADIKADPRLFYPLWCSMRSLIASLGGPDAAGRLFQQSPLRDMELPSHRARRERLGEGAGRVFYTYPTFDVEDVEALIQLYVATHGAMPPPEADSKVSGLVGKLRDRVVETLVQLHALVEMSGFGAVPDDET